MTNALLIHGCSDKEEFYSKEYPSLSNSHWFPWLQRELNQLGIETQTPEMPNAYSPRYSEWKRIFEFFPVNQDTILVGHSCGCGFLLRYLGEHPEIKVDKLILVAPWLDPITNRKGFLDFEINPDVMKQVSELHILTSDNDTVEGIPESLDIVIKKFPSAKIQHFNKGHFTFDEMNTLEFPELLKIITV